MNPDLHTEDGRSLTRAGRGSVVYSDANKYVQGMQISAPLIPNLILGSYF